MARAVEATGQAQWSATFSDSSGDSTSSLSHASCEGIGSHAAWRLPCCEMEEKILLHLRMVCVCVCMSTCVYDNVRHSGNTPRT